MKKYMFAWGDFALSALRQAAEEKLSQFAQTVVDTQYDELRRNALNEQTKAEIGEVKKLVQKQGGFLHHIVGHVIGFIALIVLAAIFYFALAHEPSLSGAVDWIKSRFQ